MSGSTPGQAAQPAHRFCLGDCVLLVHPYLLITIRVESGWDINQIKFGVAASSAILQSFQGVQLFLFSICFCIIVSHVVLSSKISDKFCTMIAFASAFIRTSVVWGLTVPSVVCRPTMHTNTNPVSQLGKRLQATRDRLLRGRRKKGLQQFRSCCHLGWFEHPPKAAWTCSPSTSSTSAASAFLQRSSASGKYWVFSLGTSADSSRLRREILQNCHSRRAAKVILLRRTPSISHLCRCEELSEPAQT